MGLSRLVRKDTEQEKARIAVRYHNLSVSYRELDKLSDGLANALVQKGLGKGGRVGMFMHNSLEMVVCYFAIFKIGAVAVPLNNRYKSDELQYALEHCGAKLLVVDEELLPFCDETKKQTNITMLLSDSLMHLASQDESSIAISISQNDPACILYTSGTTAKPKGVMHSHSSLYHTALNQSHSLHMSQNDKVLISLSICHIAGFAGQLLSTLFAGGEVMLLRQFNVDVIFNAFDQHMITHLMLLPAQLQQLVSSPNAQMIDFSSLKICVVGGDKVHLNLHKQFYQLTGKYVCECCGMTESFSYAINIPPQQEHLGSIGKPAHATELKIMDDNQQHVRNADAGEIIVKSLANMLGYWNNPEATQEVLRNGWVYTGDLGYQDADGYFWFAGRKKDIIISGGSNISPLEVENVIYMHPDVKEVGVFGHPDPVLGQRVHAAVVLNTGKSMNASDLRNFIASHLADYKIPEQITFSKSLPHNAIGKLDRKKLAISLIPNS